METLDRLSIKKLTLYNITPTACPSPFLVRLVGPDSGVIDMKFYNETKDILGFGKTLEEAAQTAFVKQSQYALCLKIARQFGWSIGVTWQKINKVKETLAVPTIEDAIEFLSASYVTRNNRFVAD